MPIPNVLESVVKERVPVFMVVALMLGTVTELLVKMFPRTFAVTYRGLGAPDPI